MHEFRIRFHFALLVQLLGWMGDLRGHVSRGQEDAHRPVYLHALLPDSLLLGQLHYGGSLSRLRLKPRSRASSRGQRWRSCAVVWFPRCSYALLPSSRIDQLRRVASAPGHQLQVCPFTVPGVVSVVRLVLLEHLLVAHGESQGEEDRVVCLFKKQVTSPTRAWFY